MEKKTTRWCRTNFGKKMISREAKDSYLQDCVKNNNVIAAYRHGCRVAQATMKIEARILATIGVMAKEREVIDRACTFLGKKKILTGVDLMVFRKAMEE